MMEDIDIREIGGYLEFENYHLPMLHEGAVTLNSGRNCLAYLIRAKRIKKIAIPKLLCASVRNVCVAEGALIRGYSINSKFEPENIVLDSDEWIYLVNYYGQINNEFIEQLRRKYQRIIVDNSQAYFQMPVKNVDTLYTCRKYFGVPDGGILYTKQKLKEDLECDISYERMHYLMGRYEECASAYYHEYIACENKFDSRPIMRMSKLTKNILHSISYEEIKQQRTKNFELLHRAFGKINKLELVIPQGAFMYPLFIENGSDVRERLQVIKIYIPKLWSDVFEICMKTELEYQLAKNILPLPVDQRYHSEDMQYMIQKIKEVM